MKLVLWVGNESNQKGLSNKISAAVEIVGIVRESRPHKRKLTFRKIFEKFWEKLFLRSISKAWIDMKYYYHKKYPIWPNVPILDTVSINTDDVYEFTMKLKPDLIVVSGTSIVKKKLLSIKPSIGIVNLHTGLSPYIKGGPNCTNWCIANDQPHLIGNTIMWIDAGIDSGSIIATELTEFSGHETLTEVHIKVMEHAHDLYVRSIQKVGIIREVGISQNQIAEGKVFYSRDWGLKEKIKLVINFRNFSKEIASDSYREKRAHLKLINL